MLRSPPSTRRWQTVAYLCFIVAGVTAVLFTAPSVRTTSSPPLVIMWVTFLVAGGGLSAAGRILGRWAGEFVGIPLLAAAFVIYAAAILYTTIASGLYTGFPAASALAALFAIVAARWAEVNQIRVEAVKDACAERADPGHRRDKGCG